MDVPHFKQKYYWTCGPAVMKMVLAHCKIKKSEESLARLMKTNKKHGTDHRQFPLVAEKYRLEYLIGRKNSTIKELKEVIKNGYKIIICYYLKKRGDGHYAVIKSIENGKINLIDPSYGPRHKFSVKYFKKIWFGNKTHKGWYIGIRK